MVIFGMRLSWNVALTAETIENAKQEAADFRMNLQELGA